MERRNFLRTASLAGVSLSLPFGAGSALAGSDSDGPYEGPYWLFIQAAGGWDTRFMFDPIMDPDQNRPQHEIGNVGPFKFSIWGANEAGVNVPTAGEPYLYDNQRFLEKYSKQLLLLNGLDMGTSSHASGSRAFSSGRSSGNGAYPATAALIAAQHARDQTLAFIGGGAYNQTNGLVPMTRLGNANAMRKLAFFNRIDATKPDSATFHTESTLDRIKRAQASRNQSYLNAQRLPGARASIEQLMAMRASKGSLSGLIFPDPPVKIPVRGLEGYARQAELILAAFKSGLCASGNMMVTGFDTHANNDNPQRTGQLKVLSTVNFIMEEAARLGIADKVNVVVGSDFARTPRYNAGNGKDHWSISSAFLMGPAIRGGRVIGGTSDTQRALKIDPKTLEVVEKDGVKLTAKILHQNIRKAANVGDVAFAYPLKGEELDLFS